MIDPADTLGLARLARRAPPRRVVAWAALALLLPSVGAVLLGDDFRSYSPIFWMVALAPTFLVAYFRCGSATPVPLVLGLLSMVAAETLHRLDGFAPGDPRVMLSEAGRYLAVGIAVGLLARLIHRERVEAVEMALTDGLTGLPNRRLGEILLDREFAAYGRGRKLCVVLWDLDGFKRFNDSHGHMAGDRALEEFGRILAVMTRAMNLSARWGGDEFLSIVSSSTLDGAMVFVQRVQELLARCRIDGQEITVSAGVAVCGPEFRTVAELVDGADRALYEAKSRGRGLHAVVTGGARADEDPAAKRRPIADPSPAA